MSDGCCKRSVLMTKIDLFEISANIAIIVVIVSAIFMP